MATPTLVQYSTFASQQGNPSSLRWLPLPNAVLSGNCVIVCLTCGNSETPTITDDQANTYTTAINVDDTTHGQRLMIAYKANCTNAPTKVKITGTGFTYTSATVTEWYNIATASVTDGTQSATGTTANPKPASMTTTVSGDLVISAFVRDDNSLPITSWTSPSGTLVSADIEDAWAVQYQVQGAAGAIQPQITWDSASYSWIAAQVAFKNATQGTAPSSTPRVVGVHHQAVNRAGTGDHWTGQLPCGLSSGNNSMLYGAYIGVSADAMTSIADSSSNTWTNTGANFLNGGSGNVRAAYVKAPTLSYTGTLTINFGGTGAIPGDTLMFYECVGMDQSSPFDNHTTASGNQAAGTSFTGATNTPSTSSGIIFYTLGVTSNTVTGATAPTGVVFPTSTDPNEEVSPWPNDENNGWAFYINSDTTARAITWTNDIHVDAWACIADSFKAVAVVDTLFGQACL